MQPTELDIYARVSRASDKREQSTPGQVNECKDIAAERGSVVGQIHVDSSYSAWNVKVTRPGWEALMARLESGAVAGVIVFELSRFARRSSDGLRLLRAAENGLVVIDSENEYDFNKPRDRKTFRDAISANEFESDMISSRTRRGMKRRVIDRALPNMSRRPYGFERDGMTVRRSEAEVLRLAATRLLAGESALSIIAWMNEEGFQTCSGRPWTTPSLRATLIRPGAVGDIAYKGEVVHRDAHEGVLARDVYDRLIAYYGSRRRGRPAAYLATGMVRCVCGHTLHIRHESMASGYLPYEDGTERRQYRCHARLGGCGNRVDQRTLDAYLRKMAIAFLSDPTQAEQVERQAQATDEELETVNAEIAELEQLAEQLSVSLGKGTLKLNRYQAAIGPLDDQLARLIAKRTELLAHSPARAAFRVQRTTKQWEQRFDAGDLGVQREILAEALRGRRVSIGLGGRNDTPAERCTIEALG